MKVQFNSKFVVRPIGNDTALMNIDTGDLFSLNETATRIWTGLASGQDKEEIAKRLCAEFDTHADEAYTAIEKLIVELRENQIIV